MPAEEPGYTPQSLAARSTVPSRPETRIGAQSGERTDVIRTRVDDVEDLEEHQRRERHRLRVAQASRTVDEATWQGDVEREQRTHCHDRSDEGDAAPHLRCQHTFADRTWLLTHQVVARRVDAEGQY